MSAASHILNGQVAIVTGAGRGIGRAIAEAYAAAGAAVGCAARTESELAGTVSAIAAQGGRALAVPTDVTQLDSVQHMMRQTVAQFGGLDILVLNAGVHQDRRSVAESHPADWRATIEVNLTGAYHCAHAAIPARKQRGAGKIITIGSGLGHRGLVGSSAYACSKAGLWMLTRVLAQELWRYNISVNELIPGPVHTAMSAQEEGEPGSVSAIDSEWVKTPADVVPMAMFLATQPVQGPTAQSFSLMRREA